MDLCYRDTERNCQNLDHFQMENKHNSLILTRGLKSWREDLLNLLNQIKYRRGEERQKFTKEKSLERDNWSKSRKEKSRGLRNHLWILRHVPDKSWRRSWFGDHTDYSDIYSAPAVPPKDIKSSCWDSAQPILFAP